VATTKKPVGKVTKASKTTKAKKADHSNSRPQEKGTSGKTARKAGSTTVASASTNGRKRTATIDRRLAGDRRTTVERRQKNEPVAVERRSIERRKKVSRRRQIDPTTCERDYTVDEVEFMNALDDYKRTSGRMFPTCSEVLEVLRGLGYAKCLGEEASLANADEPQAEPLAVLAE